MLVHRLSSTRLVSTFARNNDQYLFVGSCLNRQKTEPVARDEEREIKKRTGEGHTLSNRSKDKIRNKIEAIFRASNGFTFATLTFINQVEDNKAVQVLNKFLTVVRKRCPGLQYMWVAERQENGNIHFHLITNKFLKVQYYNALWVIQQYNAGIELPGLSFVEMMAGFKAGKLQKLLNPFDIKECRTVQGLAMYLTCYVTKNNSSFDCAPWYCSRGVSAVFTSVLVGENVVKHARNVWINYSVNTQTGEVFEAKTYVSEYATVVYIYNKKYFNRQFKIMDKINQKILAGLKDVIIPKIEFFEYDCLYNKPFTRSKKIIINEIMSLPRVAN